MRRHKSLQRKRKQPPRELDRLEVAAELDLSPETITGYKALGCPCERRGRKDFFDPAEVLAWMKANGKTGDAHRPVEGNSEDFQKAKLRKENALAAKYELDVRDREGKSLPKSDVMRWIGENITAAKNKFIGLGAALAPLLEGRDAAERQSIIDDRVIEILNELAGSSAALAGELEAAAEIPAVAVG
jgi:hypothetical protein